MTLAQRRPSAYREATRRDAMAAAGPTLSGSRGRRALDRRGVRDDKNPAVAHKVHLREPSACQICGSVYLRKTWRHDHPVTRQLMDEAQWTECPACKQARREEGFGKVILRGSYLDEHEDAIRRRIAHVADRAEFTQPLHRIAAIGRERDGLEVITTSQKLAHRIAHELHKAFHGETRYSWSDRDGALLAIWERGAETNGSVGRRRR
jgi:NMD protein affecting ribosome stability and mRNA decay